METLTVQTFRFDDFELDAAKRLLSKSGSPVALKSKAFDLLLALVESRGRVLSKDELLEKVWPGQFVEEGNLKVHISALRKILGDGRGENRFIVTVPGRGYSFVADLNGGGLSDVIVETRNLSTITIDESVVHSKTHSLTLRRFATLGIAMLTIGGIAALAAYFFWPSESSISIGDYQIRQLTTHGKIVRGALSPDGKLFAFAQGSTGNPVGLWMGHTAGGEPIELRPAAGVWYHGLHFSRDSSDLYFVVSDREPATSALFRMPVLGGVPEKLRDVDRGHISFSPDMERFAYVKNDSASGESRLMTTETRGSGEVHLAVRPIRTPFLASTVAWSPDGRTIAVGALREGSGDNDTELLTVSVDERRVTQLSARAFSSIVAISWTGNGNGLLISATEPPRWDGQIFMVSFPDGEISPFTTDLHTYSDTLGISADGGKILSLRLNTLSNLWKAPADDLANARQITVSSVNGRAGTHGLEWLSDGTILFPAFADRSQPLWLVDSDGGNLKRLTPDGSLDQQPGVSADGSTIVFTSNRKGAAEIWRMDADGQNLRPLTSGGHNDMPSISPDGKTVVYVSNRDGLATIWRIGIDGGEPFRLTDHYASWPRISPDSRFVAYATRLGGKSQLVVIPIEGGSPTRVFDVPRSANFRFGVRWTPDGQAIAYRDWTNGYWRQPLDATPPERLKGLPEEKLFSFAWSPDGKAFVYSRGTETRDLVLFANPVK